MNNNQPPYIVFLTGASGAGKTTLLDAFSQESNPSTTACLHFDSVGVPSEQEMIKQYGSGRAWQKAMTYFWVNKISREFSDKKIVLIEGQVDINFILAAFHELQVTHYKIILVHCDNAIRHKRLHEDRNQPELINPEMDNWSNYLKKQANEMSIAVIDTTSMKMGDMIKALTIHLLV